MVGLGEAVPRPSVYGETLEGMRAVLEELLVPSLLGRDPLETERAWAIGDGIVGNQSARTAIDVALHDLVGQVAGLPLYRLLGGWTDGTISLTMAIAIGPTESMADAAQRAVAEGYRAIKLKVGKDLEADVAVVAAVRAAIGRDTMLYVDANCGYARHDALRAARAFERHDLAFFEEPIAAWDTEGRAQLARSTDIPILLDESTNDPGGLGREIAWGTAGGVSIRAARSGVTMTRHLVGRAMLSNVPWLVGSHRELGIGAAANAHLGAGLRGVSLPAELGSHVLLTDSLLVEPLAIANGSLRLSTRPGLGVALDPERVARYRLWSVDLGEVAA
jgi:L-alanine-DL-glutamate epimerase-like enolase superfamily enzyme